MDTAQLKLAYLDFVRLQNQPPASVYIFTNQLGIPEAEFYQSYPNFAAIDRSLERLVHVPLGPTAEALPVASPAMDDPREFVRRVTAALIAGQAGFALAIYWRFLHHPREAREQSAPAWGVAPHVGRDGSAGVALDVRF